MTLRRVWNLLKGYKKNYIAAGVIAFFAVFFYSQRNIMLRIIVDSALQGQPVADTGIYGYLANLAGGPLGLRDKLWLCGLALLFTVLMYGVCIFVRDRLTALASEGMAKDLKDNLYDAIQRMTYNWHVNSKAGDLIQRCTSDVETVRKFLSAQVITILRIVIQTCIALYVLFNTNVRIAFVGLISLPFIFCASFFFHKAVVKNFKVADEMEGDLSTHIQESVTGVRVVRAFGRGRYELDKFNEKNERLTKMNTKLNHILSIYWSSSDVVCFAQIGAVLLYGVYLVHSHDITIGELVMVNAFEASILWPLRQLGRVLSDMGKMQISIGRLYEILDTPIEEHNPADTKDADLTGDIVIDHLTFGYGTSNVLEDVSFTVRAGETVAILGTTGSGKSSLMHMFLRLYDYICGSIKIGGVELNTIDKTLLRHRVGLVAQDPFLYSKSIRENLLMANGAATEAEITEAAEIAKAHAYISGFEHGYETRVGERGVTLSGGQKQRAVIARTLLKESDILIFDDSLSAVDSETDAHIRAALADRKAGITTFIISQRITTLMGADKIIVLEDGRLTEQGTHEELINFGGLYSRIWAIQNMLEDEFEEEASANV